MATEIEEPINYEYNRGWADAMDARRARIEALEAALRGIVEAWDEAAWNPKARATLFAELQRARTALKQD
jgi:hypothetical protein